MSSINGRISFRCYMENRLSNWLLKRLKVTGFYVTFCKSGIHKFHRSKSENSIEDCTSDITVTATFRMLACGELHISADWLSRSIEVVQTKDLDSKSRYS